jgi:predicted transcriptional regulator
MGKRNYKLKNSATAAVQKRRCFEMKLLGYNQDEIAAELGVSQPTVSRRLAEAALEHVAPVAEEYRLSQVYRLEMQLRRLDKAAANGDEKAISVITRIEALLSKIVGTEAPKKIELESRTASYELDGVNLEDLE